MRDYLTGALVALGAMAMAAAICDIRHSVESPMPRLIGHDCLGSGGDIWAMEESDFPTPCGTIEPYR